MFDEAVRLLREATAETRRLISGLRPPILDESGIVAAIEYLISEQRQQGGPEIEFVHPADVDRLAAPLEGAVFRIVQECLTNACRYSQSAEGARRIEGWRRTACTIEVQDWGIGFDAAEVEGGHIGLQGIRQRAQLLGGAAAIEAGAGQGNPHPRGTPLSSAAGKRKRCRTDFRIRPYSESSYASQPEVPVRPHGQPARQAARGNGQPAYGVAAGQPRGVGLGHLALKVHRSPLGIGEKSFQQTVAQELARTLLGQTRDRSWS